MPFQKNSKAIGCEAIEITWLFMQWFQKRNGKDQGAISPQDSGDFSQKQIWV